MKLMPMLRDHESATEHTGFCGLLIEFPTYNSVYSVCELTGRTCQVVRLEQRISGDRYGRTTSEDVWAVPSAMRFCTSLEAISTAHQDVKSTGKKGIPLFMVELNRIDSSTATDFQLEFQISEQTLVVSMRQRKEYRARKPKPETSRPLPTSGNDDGEVGFEDGFDADADAGLIDLDLEVSGSSEEEDVMLDNEMNDLMDELQGDVASANDSVHNTGGSDSDELLHDEQCQDMADLDSIHASFVATVSEQQHTSGLGGIGRDLSMAVPRRNNFEVLGVVSLILGLIEIFSWRLTQVQTGTL